MTRINYLLLVLLVAFVSACGGDDKDRAPEVVITFPAENTSFVRSEDFTFSGTITDDVELKEIKFALSFKSGLKGIEDPWVPADDVRTLTGKEKVYTNEILFKDPIIYECKAGIYTLLVTVTDKAGNITEKSVDVTID